jgi:hypothetical protein
MAPCKAACLWKYNADAVATADQPRCRPSAGWPAARACAPHAAARTRHCCCRLHDQRCHPGGVQRQARPPRAAHAAGGLPHRPAPPGLHTSARGWGEQPSSLGSKSSALCALGNHCSSPAPVAQGFGGQGMRASQQQVQPLRSCTHPLQRRPAGAAWPRCPQRPQPPCSWRAVTSRRCTRRCGSSRMQPGLREVAKAAVVEQLYQGTDRYSGVKLRF